jgi:hypothetical protein
VPAGPPKPIPIGLLAGYGFGNYWGLGVGARAGVLTFGEELYFGGAAQYFFGSTTSTDGGLSGLYEVAGKRVVGGAEAGFEAKIDSVHVRPYLGVGLSVLLTRTCDEGLCGDDTKLGGTLGPGALITWHSGPLFVGGDLRYVVVLGDSGDSAPQLMATAGLVL